MTTRSKALVVLGATVGADVVCYTSPPGVVTLVKSLYASRAAGSPGNFVVRANRPGSAVVEIFASTSLELFATATATLWIVLAPGDQLIYTLASGTMFLWISGAVLPEPGP